MEWRLVFHSHCVAPHPLQHTLVSLHSPHTSRITSIIWIVQEVIIVVFISSPVRTKQLWIGIGLLFVQRILQTCSYNFILLQQSIRFVTKNKMISVFLNRNFHITLFHLLLGLALRPPSWLSVLNRLYPFCIRSWFPKFQISNQISSSSTFKIYNASMYDSQYLKKLNPVNSRSVEIGRWIVCTLSALLCSNNTIKLKATIGVTLSKRDNC